MLEWANDPATRAASFHPEPIERADHVRWLASRLASPSTRLLIGLADGRPFGQVRLERKPDGSAEIGIAVAPERRGQGLGRGLLAAAAAVGRADATLAVERFVARVRTENAVSIRLFERAGFSIRERSEYEGFPCLVYELVA